MLLPLLLALAAADVSPETAPRLKQVWTKQEYAAQKGSAFGMSRRTFVDPDARPCNEEPWGALAAIDVASGKVRWEAPMPVSAHSVPGTYVWKGRRYVVVSAGGHGKATGSKLGGAVVAFAVEGEK